MGAGLAFHKHNEAWSIVVSGRKRWFLFEPNDIQGDPPVVQRLEEGYESAGDLLFVPGWYSHAVVALEETVAMSAVLSMSMSAGASAPKLACPREGFLDKALRI